MKSLLKENPLKTSEDLATFSDAYIALKALGGDHPRASSDIKAYKNFETDSTYSLKDCYYIARVTGSCDNNQIFKTFVARAPTSDEDLISIINEYYYIWTIYKDNYQNSDKSKDFMQTLGSSFVKNVFPYLTTQLKLKVKGESFLKKQVGYVLEMAAFFRKVSKDANEGHITKVVKEGLSSLISESFVTSGDRRAFRSV